MDDDRPLIIFAIYRLNSGNNKPHQLCVDKSVLKWKESWVIEPYLNMFIDEFLLDLKKGARGFKDVARTEENAHLPDINLHAFHHPEGLLGFLATGKKYDMVAAQMIMSKGLEKFMEENPRKDWASGTATFNDPKVDGLPICKAFKDPSKVNKMAAIQKDLDETVDTLRQAIQQTTLRGERLDEMVQKSEHLSSSSKMFYQQSKKQNSCCTLM